MIFWGHMFKTLIKKVLNRYVYQDWNIAIADIGENLTPVNIKWMKHRYKDRWFADPFIVNETQDAYIVLAEECLHGTGRGRIARLTLAKRDCSLLKNEPILDLPTHLSFPNPIEVDNQMYIYPENASAGNTKYYEYGEKLNFGGVLSECGLADPVIIKGGDQYYLLATQGADCNGNRLTVWRSENPLGGYKKFQEIVFSDNIARRAGNVFSYKGYLISPAQICNNDYGEGVSFQKIEIKEDGVHTEEIKRIYPPTKEYPEGFHTYNVHGDKVAIDGYRYGSPLLHKLYFKIRKSK